MNTTMSRPGGKAPTASLTVVEQREDDRHGHQLASPAPRPVSITTTKTALFATHDVTVDGQHAGQVSEAFNVPAAHYPCAAVAQGIMLGWHRTRDQAVGAIIAVHEAVQAERRTR